MNFDNFPLRERYLSLPRWRHDEKSISKEYRKTKNETKDVGRHVILHLQFKLSTTIFHRVQESEKFERHFTSLTSGERDNQR